MAMWRIRGCSIRRQGIIGWYTLVYNSIAYVNVVWYDVLHSTMSNYNVLSYIMCFEYLIVGYTIHLYTIWNSTLVTDIVL